MIRPEATVELVSGNDLTLLNVMGLVDERFKGFGAVSATKTIILNVAGITRMTSFGVRQWLKAMDSLPKAVTEMLLVGCPTFFVDQLNMVLNFGGPSKVLTVNAPYTCPSCGVESSETIDLLKERDNLAADGLPNKRCARCDGKLEFDETPSSYFAFVPKFGAQSLTPSTAAFLAAQNLYAARDVEPDKPPKIMKLVYGSVTYFRIIGRIASTFRARPFLVGAEGEVVIDLADVSDVDPTGQKEWQRLLRSLSAQVPSVTLIDLKESLLPAMDRSLDVSANIVLGSLLVPYVCLKCQRRTAVSSTLHGRSWPPQFEPMVCGDCNGAMRHEIGGSSLIRLKNANTTIPAATEHMIAQRHQLLNSAISDANTPLPTDYNNSAASAADDTILGKYKIVQRLPASGLAEVFLAKQVGIGGFEKPVILKRIPRALLGQQGTLEQLLREVNRAARLSHPNIAQVLDVGEVDDTLYLATEYVAGQDLWTLLERLASARVVMPIGDVCHIARDIAQAVEHAYSAADIDGRPLSVIHGDLSPHNIIIRTDGTVKVSDFGVAIAASQHADVQFMAPEVISNEAITHRSDLFSMGMLLYAICSGSTSVSELSQKDIIKKLRSGKLRFHGELANVPPSLFALISQLLSTNPDERPGRASEVSNALADITRNLNVVSSAQSLSRFLSEIGFFETTATPEPRASSGTQPLPATFSLDPPIALARVPTRNRSVALPPAPASSRGRTLLVAGVAVSVVAVASILRYLLG